MELEDGAARGISGVVTQPPVPRGCGKSQRSRSYDAKGEETHSANVFTDVIKHNTHIIPAFNPITGDVRHTFFPAERVGFDGLRKLPTEEAGVGEKSVSSN